MPLQTWFQYCIVLSTLATSSLPHLLTSNQLLASLDGTDGIDLKKLVPLLEQWHETVNGEWSTRDIELIINVKDNSNHV